MRAWISRFLDVREGEGLPLAQAFLTLFGLIAAHTIMETARDALFLTKLPANRLTFVYALLAVITLLASSLNARLVRAFGRRNALVFTLLVAAYGTTIFHFQEQTPAVVFGLYVWSGLIGTVLVIQFWMFAGQLFSISQGKRLFGPLTSGGVLGAVVGASVAAVVLSKISIPSLLLISAALFIFTAIVLTTVSTEEMRVPVPASPGSVPLTNLGGVMQQLREQPYLLRLAILTALSTSALLAVDYLFKSVAASHAQGRDLGEMIARYYAVLNAVALVVQVGIAGRLVRKQGVFLASMILPTLLFAGSFGVLLFGGVLSLVMLTKGADGSLRHSLHRVSSELLWMPVPPEARDRAKAFIDGVVPRLSSAVTAGLIFLLSAIGWTAPRFLAAIVLGLVFCWLAAAVAVRAPYLDLIRQALRKGFFADESMPGELDLDSVEAVLESLSSRDPSRVIAAMDLLADRKRSRLIPALILYHESDDVLVRALEIMSTSGRREDWLPLAERLMSNGSESVRVAVVRALVAQGREDLVQSATEDPSPAVAAHATFATMHASVIGDPLEYPRVRELLAATDENARQAKLALLDAIRDHGDRRYSGMVQKMAVGKDPELVQRASSAMAALKDPIFIPTLIDRLTIRDGRAAVRMALVELGDEAFNALEKAFADTATDPKIRLHIPRTISRFGTQRAADFLMKYVSVEPSGPVRYKLLRGLGRLVAEHPEVKIDRATIDAGIHRNLLELFHFLSLRVPLEAGKNNLPKDVQDSSELVIGLLLDKEKNALERAFRYLQIAHRHEDIRSVYLALSSNDRRVRSSAGELLDVVTLPHDRGSKIQDQNREMWLLAADDLGPAERVLRAQELVPNPPATYAQAMSRLVREPDEYLASLAGYHALELGSDALRDEVIEVYENRPSLRVILAQVTQIPRLAIEGV
jgi:ATP/ADP translocase